MRLLGQIVFLVMGIYLLTVAGTFHKGRQAEPFSLMLYSSIYDGLFRANVEGQWLDQIAIRPLTVQNIYWTPDKSWMIVSGTYIKDYRIYRMRPDGSQRQEILAPLRSTRFLSWSPDGTWMTFTADHPIRDMNLYVSRPDGRNVQQITFGNEYAHFQTWSPDGIWVYFLANRRDEAGTDLYRVHSDGTGRENITNNPRISVRFAAWSPNGEWMILSVRHHDRTFIYRMQPDGSHLENLTDKYNAATFSSFSPDGELIYFSALTNRGLTLYGMRIDGNDKRPLEVYLQHYKVPISAQYSNRSRMGGGLFFKTMTRTMYHNTTSWISSVTILSS